MSVAMVVGCRNCTRACRGVRLWLSLMNRLVASSLIKGKLYLSFVCRWISPHGVHLGGVAVQRISLLIRKSAALCVSAKLQQFMLPPVCRKAFWLGCCTAVLGCHTSFMC